RRCLTTKARRPAPGTGRRGPESSRRGALVAVAIKHSAPRCPATPLSAMLRMSSKSRKPAPDATSRAMLRAFVGARKGRRKPGRKPALSRREVGLALALRRRGAGDKFILAKLEEKFGKRICRRALTRALSRFVVLARRRSPVLTLLEETRGQQ